MTHARFRTVGLAFLVALGLMALSATSAQAANEFLLLHPGSTFAEEGVAEETFTGEQEGTGRLIVPNLNIEITCSAAQVNEGKVFPTLLHATIRFTGCEVWVVKHVLLHYYDLVEPLKVCHIPNLEIVAKVRAVPVLHEKETFLLFEALEKGSPIAVVTYLSGTGCPLPLKSNITGSVVGLPTQLNVPEQLIAFNPEITLLWQAEGLPKDRLFYGVNEAWLEVNFYKLLLTGAFEDEPWGAH